MPRFPLDPSSPATDARAAFADALQRMDKTRAIMIVGHFDADGLAATAILARSLSAAGRLHTIRIVGKGENPWDASFGQEIAARAPGGLIVTDLGVRAPEIADGVPTILIDHHVPTGEPADTITVSGNGLTPEPTSALLAWWCAGALGNADEWLWLAALGLIGDMAPEDAFPELAVAQARWGKTALRNAVSLINAPRRTAAADAGPALTLLLKADGPKDILSARYAETQVLLDAKAEVKAELDAAKRTPPQVAGDVALIRFSSPCQIHPLVAQQWRGRLRDKIVLAANTGYRPGWVHFAARSASGRDLIAFLAEHRPAGADAHYGNGHAQATGGALRPGDWNAFVRTLGFPQAQVPA